MTIAGRKRYRLGLNVALITTVAIIIVVGITTDLLGANGVSIELARNGATVSSAYIGRDHEIRISIENDIMLSAMSIGFYITTPDGVSWTWLTQPNGYGPDGFQTGGRYLTVVPGSRMDPADVVWDNTDLLLVETNMDGVTPDTVFPGGVAINNGLPTGPSQHMMSIHFRVTGATPGPTGTICIDSTFVPPNGDFVFSPPSSLTFTPDFNGPICWTVIEPPCPYDTDGDKWGDPGHPENECYTDNCPLVSNPSQSDIDGDGIGDVCDPVFNGVVTNLNDAGAGSLRAAIEGANSAGMPAEIVFQVSGIIGLNTALPALSGAGGCHIDGTTAPGGQHSVILDGSAMSSGCSGLDVQTSNCMIEGLTIRDFPCDGILVGGAGTTGVTITNNLIYENGELAIDLGGDEVTENDVGDADTGPNGLLNYPTLDSVKQLPDETFAVFGKSVANGTTEFYVAHPVGQGPMPPDPSQHGEAYEYFGSSSNDPLGNFSLVIPTSLKRFTVVTMTAIDPLGNTSECSRNFFLIPQPMNVVIHSPVNVIITDPLGRRFGKDADGNLIAEISPADYFENPDDSVLIYQPLIGDYVFDFVTETGTPEGSTYSAIVRVDGTAQLVLAANEPAPNPGTTATYPYKVEEGYHYVNGDGNGDNNVNVADAVFVINLVFKGGPPPDPIEAADANCDHGVNVADAVRLINYVFKLGLQPCAFTP